MDPAFCPETRQLFLEAAGKLGLNVRPTGTCVTIEGPRFSSKAESLLYKSWGVQLVNMTMVPEVITMVSNIFPLFGTLQGAYFSSACIMSDSIGGSCSGSRALLCSCSNGYRL